MNLENVLRELREKASFSYEIITPAVAEEMLLHNENNRPLQKRTVDKYIADLRNGKWDITANAITFFDDGTLGDGQHRLNAVIASKIPAIMLVARDIPRSGSYDNNLKRSAKDAIAMGSGKVYPKGFYTIASLAIILSRKSQHNMSVSNHELEGWLERNNEEFLGKAVKMTSSCDIKNGEISLTAAPIRLGIYSFLLKYEHVPNITEKVASAIKVLKTNFSDDTPGAESIRKLRREMVGKFSGYEHSISEPMSSGTARGRALKVKLVQQALELYINGMKCRTKVIPMPDNYLFPLGL